MSYSEQLVLDAFARRAPSDWFLMHSLWLKEHETKQHAELDFLVITSRAALILEVKGGVVFRDAQGEWHYCTKDLSQERIKKEGPFDQARSAFYAVRNYFQQNGVLHLFQDRIWGYGVILPQCIMDIAGPDPAIKADMLLDARAFPEGLCDFINELSDYWEDDNLRQKEKNRIPRERLKRQLSASDRRAIIDLMRPAVRPVLGASMSARDAERQLIELTQEQLKALEFHDADQPMILKGAAGTGKTLLAMQQAHRQSVRGKRVLFVCFNKKLASHIRRELGPHSIGRGVDVYNYHQLLSALFRQGGLADEPVEDWGRFNKEVEDRTLYALQTLHNRGEPFEPYDYLVVDEAQDLMTAPFIGSLDLLVHGGWRGGAWTICIDPRQVIFHDHYDPCQFERLEQLGSICPLNVNCRNTREVAAYAHGLSRVDGVPTRKASGPQPRLVWYSDRRQYVKHLRTTVNTLIDEMSPLSRGSRDIAILAVTMESLPDELFAPGCFKRRVVELGSDTSEEVVQCGTLQSFKGLEAMAVVLVGLEDLDSLSSRQLAYVGGSRAKSFLGVLLPDHIQGTVQQRLPDILALLGRESESR